MRRNQNRDHCIVFTIYDIIKYHLACRDGNHRTNSLSFASFLPSSRLLLSLGMDSKNVPEPKSSATCSSTDDVLSGYLFQKQSPTLCEDLLELHRMPSFYSDESLNPTWVPIHFKPSQYNLTALHEIRLADQHVVYDLSANLPAISLMKSDYQLTEMEQQLAAH
jgi:hypothetical protein